MRANKGHAFYELVAVILVYYACFILVAAVYEQYMSRRFLRGTCYQSELFYGLGC